MDDSEIKFTKVFKYNKTGHEWKLPRPDLLFAKEGYEIGELMELKTTLNELKSSLNGYDIKEWNRHTNYVNPAGKILQAVKRDVEPELATQAWCKFYEILSHDLVIPPKCSDTINAVHLCEAPGGFICSLNHFLKSHEQLKNVKYRWIANALNPYHEGNTLDQCILDDRLICKTPDSWYFGTDNTGNILKDDFLMNLKQKCLNAFSDSCINVVTADGSFNCQSRPAEQETIVAHLKYAEVFTALQLLGKGGTFVMKMFTLFEYHSLSLIYFFCCLFSSVTVIKPATSKAGNSEAYVVSCGYCGSTAVAGYLEQMSHHFPFKNVVENCVSLLPQFSIPESFIAQHVDCTRSFSLHQQIAIKRNVLLFHHRSKFHTTAIKKLQQIFTQRYFDLCEMRRLSHGSFIVQRPVARSHIRLTPKMEGTFSQRVVQKNNHETPLSLKTTEVRTIEPICFSDADVMGKISICRGLVPEEVNSSLYCSTDIIVNYSNAYREAASRCALPDETRSISPDLLAGKALSHYLSELIQVANGSVTTLSTSSSDGLKCDYYRNWFTAFVQTTFPSCTIDQLVHPNADTKELVATKFVFCNLVADTPSLWPEVSMRPNLSYAFLTALQVLEAGGTCFFILPTALLRITAHLLFVIGHFFEKLHVQSLPPNRDTPCSPALAFLGQGFKDTSDNNIMQLRTLLEECCKKTSDVVEVLPVTYLMVSEEDFSSMDAKQRFIAALKHSNELNLFHLTHRFEKKS